MRRLLLFGLAGWLAAGCSTAAPKSVVKKPFPAVARVAVFPVNNQTANQEGAAMLRNVVQRELAARGYVTLPQPLVDKALAELQIHDATDLRSVSPQTVRAKT